MLLSKKQAFQNTGWSNQRFGNYLGSYPVVSYTRKLNSLSHFLRKQKAIRIGLNHYRLKQFKVLTLKHDDMQYSASAQFCSGSSEVLDLLSHARSLSTKIILRVEICQEILWIDWATKYFGVL